VQLVHVQQRWLLGEPRPPVRWWIPSAADLRTLARYACGESDSGGVPRDYDESAAALLV